MTERTTDSWPIPTAEAIAVAGGLVPEGNNEGTVSPYERVEQALESHMVNERALMDRYASLANESTDPVVQLIMGLIIDDEERHHTVMGQLAARLHDDLAWTHSPNALPVGPPNPSVEEHEALRDLVAIEETSVRDMRELAKDAEGLYHGVAGALIQMMTLDSQKHAELLRFLFRREGEALSEHP